MGDETDGTRTRLVAREFKTDETMYDVFTSSSTPSAGRIIDNLSVKKSYHIFIADVPNAYFHVDEDEECYVNPTAEWLEQQAALGNRALATAKVIVWPPTRWVTLGRLLAERSEEQSFDWCDADPQPFANDELDVFIEVHMDDLHGIGPRPALDLVQTNLSQKIRFKIWTVNEVGMKITNTSSVSECCMMTRLESCLKKNSCG